MVELYGKSIEEQSGAYIVFNESDDKVYGNAGCNSFNGGFTTQEGNRISFDKVATTLMACPDMAVEDQFKKMLETADNYAVSADKLSIHKARMAPLARFEAVYFETVISE